MELVSERALPRELEALRALAKQEHALARPGVWVARRVDIARHWAEAHPHGATEPVGDRGDAARPGSPAA